LIRRHTKRGAIVLRRLFGRKPRDIGELDAMVIAQLRKAGADLRLPRDTIHYLYFPTQEGANVAAGMLRAEGLTAEAKPAAAGELPWVVIANHDYVVNDETIRAIRAVAEDAARVGGGEYDGWEAAAVP
jgi:hypothetical protein